MADSSAGFHEALERLTTETMDHHRAIVSLMEELEAVDWYAQRIDATDDADLAAVLTHNRDEEKEHAAMVLEWLRRRDPALDKHLRRYLFSDGPIAELAELAEIAEAAEAQGSGAPASLHIGDLRNTENL
jgi:ferritin-like protein